MDTNDDGLKDKTVENEDYSKINPDDRICSRENINWFGEKIFLESRRKFSRYTRFNQISIKIQNINKENINKSYS